MTMFGCIRARWIISSLLLALAATAAVRAEDWPCFRGPGHQGISQEKSVPTTWSATENVRWKTAIAGQGWSSPIVVGDTIFVTTATGDGSSLHLICLDRQGGQVLWDKEVIRQRAGHKQPYNSYATSTPASDGKRVYVVACDGRILGVSMDGKVEWINADFDYYSEHGLGVSPVLYEDLVIVAFDWSHRPPETKVGWQEPWDQAVILAVDKNTGKVLWRGRRGSSRIAHVTPQVTKVDGQDQLISGAGNVVQGFDVKTGERIWTVSSPGEGVVPSVVIGDGLVFTASGFGESRVVAVRLGGAKGDVTKTHTVWESRDDVPKMSSMLYVAPHLYLATETGVVKCFRAATGEVVWRQNGRMTLVEDGPEYKVLAQNDLGEKCCASPAISQGNLFIRTDKALYCLGR
jgi:outer membrane protein assembly factor BamB